MTRSQALDRLQRTLVAVVRQRREAEAAQDGWPLPERLALHLWLYAEGLAGPTPGEEQDFE